MLSFVGARYDVPPLHPVYVRNLLGQLNSSDVFVSTFCPSDDPKACITPEDSITEQVLPHTWSTQNGTASAYSEHCATDTAFSLSVNTTSMLLNSMYTIVAPGLFSHPFRLLEALAVRLFYADHTRLNHSPQIRNESIKMSITSMCGCRRLEACQLFLVPRSYPSPMLFHGPPLLYFR